MRIQAFIERKGKFNTIKNFQVLEVIPTYKKSSSISSKNLIDILEIFALLRLLLPDGEIFPKVFLDLERVFGNFPQI